MACDVSRQFSPFNQTIPINQSSNALNNQSSSPSVALNISTNQSSYPSPDLKFSPNPTSPPSVESISTNLESPAGSKRGRQRMSPWLFDQINSGEIPGLVWIDKDTHIFKIPWKHFGRPGVNGNDDALLFRRWAVHTGKFQEGEPPNPSGWKTNFRCALAKLKDIKDLPERNQNGEDPFRVFQFVEKKLEVVSSTHPSSSSASVEMEQKVIGGNECAIKREECMNYPKLQDDLIFPELNEYLNDLSFMDETLDDYDCKELINNIDGPNTESLVQTIQTMSMLQNVPQEQFSCIKVKLYYADKEVGMQIVNNPYGLRIAFRPPPSLPSDIIQGNTQQLNDIFGPSKADQICFPPTDDVCTNNILGYLGRGIVLQSRNGQIFVTRLCQARVFYSDSLNTCNNVLPREQTIVLFDFANDFYPKFRKFEVGEGPTPTFERYFSFMETWSDKSPLTSKHVRVTVTHCWAEKLFQQYQHGTSEFYYSAPNDRDVAACQIELVAQQSK